eukprot:TRINITY_DN22250_c0_g1_i1.p1 TRINITY_DN22250_c0_g1~~TRINITY_DN22250_c0_g1_i1.p1  ORF type:complete len:387 (-),score=40.69 TRINITY_DN22250_c0_g1_i1:81-1241(-)
MNPHGYSTMMKRRGFENYAYMSPKLARYVGRRVMLLLYLAWPIVGFVLGFGLSFALDTPDVLLYVAIPVIALWMWGCYMFSFCVFGRILRFERPSREYGYSWPFTFESGFIAMIILLLVLCWYGVLSPCTRTEYSSGFNITYSILLFIVLGMVVWILGTDPGSDCCVSDAPVENSEAQHQWCIFCSARAKIGVDGPWRRLGNSIQKRVTDCYYGAVRRRHCQSCQKCVNGFDHHCYYLNTCICDKNYYQFIAMLTSLFLMIAIQFVFGVLVLVNYFDNDAEVGKYAGSLDNQHSYMHDTWGVGLFCTLVFFMLAVATYALWFVGDLLYLHYYFIYRGIGMEHRFSTLDYLHEPVSYTHLRAHETPEHLVCRLLLEKKKKKESKISQ